MRFSPSLSFFLSLSLFAIGCAEDQGLAPLGDERQDESGSRFELNTDIRSGSSTFVCDEQKCDMEVVVGSFASPSIAQDLSSLKDVHLLNLTLLRPDGFTRKEQLIIGADNQGIDDDDETLVTWRHAYIDMPPGQYVATVELAPRITGSSVSVTSRLEASIVPDWDFHGLDCQESPDACGGTSFCVETCTSQCFMDEQCASGECNDLGECK